MKKPKINVLRHIASICVVVAFIFMALGSSSLFSPGNLEGPCEQITPVSSEYLVTITVSNKVTGDPIPNANVEIEVEHTNYPYLGASMCQISPAQTKYNQITRQTDAAGKIILEIVSLTYNVSIDRTRIDLSVTAENYTASQVTRRLSPESPTATIDVKLIDLTTQP